MLDIDSFGHMSVPNPMTSFLGQQFPQPVPASDIVRSSSSFQLLSGSNVCIQVYSFPRKFKGEKGKVQVPGLKDLPHGIQSNFRNMFIHHIMKLVFSDPSPWNNPSILVYQHEFDLIYSPLQYRLHIDEAVVVPVTILIS